MNSLSYKLFAPIFKLIPLKAKLRILYLRRFGRLLNLNSPKSFNEKLQLYKIKHNDSLMTICTDKVLVKDYLKTLDIDISFPKTLFKFFNESEIHRFDFNKLPDNYVLKANHTSQTILFSNKEKKLNKTDFLKAFRSWIKKDQYASLGEWSYKDIERCIFVEEFLDFKGKPPNDYKVFCFNGDPKYVQVDYDRFDKHKRNLYTNKWEFLNFEYSHPNLMPIEKKPKFLKEMLEISKIISTKFPFVRIDFYYYENKLMVGEMTFYPGGGFEKFPNYDLDIKFGNNLRL